REHERGVGDRDPVAVLQAGRLEHLAVDLQRLAVVEVLDLVAELAARDLGVVRRDPAVGEDDGVVGRAAEGLAVAQLERLPAVLALDDDELGQERSRPAFVVPLYPAPVKLGPAHPGGPAGRPSEARAGPSCTKIPRL